MSSVPGVFVAGDAGRGQSLIVWAIAEGRAVAREVDAWLMNSRRGCPARPPDGPAAHRLSASPASTQARSEHDLVVGPLTFGVTPNVSGGTGGLLGMWPRHGATVSTCRLDRMRRAKIVCTLGPATSSAEQLRELVEAGMDVARLNMSHGSHRDHEQVYRDVRKASDEVGRAVGDPRRPPGPEDPARPASPTVPCSSRRATTFTITTRDVPGDVHEVCARPTRACRATCTRATGSSSTTARSRSSSPRSTTPTSSARSSRAARSQQQQGHQPARRRGVACRRCPRRTRTTCAGRCDPAST